MPSWTLEEARDMLALWIEAEKTVATGAEYRIGSRQLKRADLAQIAERINFWRNQVSSLENGGNGRRVMRAVPRDL